MNFQSGVQVFIPAALNRPTHTLYSICMLVQPTNQEWTVNRRYSQFLQLRKDIQHKLGTRGVSCANCASFNRAISKFRFPGKSLMRTNSVVRHRVSALKTSSSCSWGAPTTISPSAASAAMRLRT